MKAVLLLMATVSLAWAAVPSYIKICDRHSPNFNECVLDSVSQLKEKFKTGIKELDIPPLDPLFIDHVDLADMPSFKASAENVEIKGLSAFKVTGLVTDFENKVFTIEAYWDRLDMTAMYDVAARIIVPVAGKGPISVISRGIKSKSIMKYKLLDRRGKKYMFFPSMTTKLVVNDYSAHFDPSDGPTSTLATAINEALEQSKQEIIASTTPNLEKAISERVLNLANKIVTHFTWDELFPDDYKNSAKSQ
ncbi:uncharacterized protein [Prorops nasuta]|uniref:uncharacterized protein n=1 Tax=Prorops nasuta TaxID=863751 RepID=UPI0034CD8145